MLITRRRAGESLLIGDAIEVAVLDVSQGRVKLGVSAPSELPVDYKEWRLVKEQNRDASGAVSTAFVQGILETGARRSGEPGFVVEARGGPAEAVRIFGQLKLDST